jgi:hypothetical protein
LKAGDAQTLGGLPASAFMLSVPGVSPQTSVPATSANSATLPPPAPVDVTTSGGTVNSLPLFTTATNIQSSIVTQVGAGAAGKIGINTAAPGATLDVNGTANIRGSLTLPATGAATAVVGKNSQPQDLIASVFNSTTSTAVAQKFQWQAEPLNNNKATATGTLNLLYASGVAVPAETGLKISNKGLLTFAAGQTFPGTGPGTITGVTAGSGLSGGGSSGNVTLSVPNGGITNAMLQHSSATVAAGTALTGGGTVPLGGSITLNLDTTKVPLLSAANTFTGNQTVNGNVAATSFSGSGAALTNVNAAALGGLGPGAFALLAGGNSFTGSQSIAGNLGISGNVTVSGAGDGVTFPDGTTQQTASIFGSAATASLVFTGSGVTNLVQLNLIVPANGVVFASASGYCNASTTSSDTQWSFDISTSASSGWVFPDPLVLFPSGSNVNQFPISATRVIAVSAGSNSIYLNVDNITGSALTSCGAVLTGVFTPTQIPAAVVRQRTRGKGAVSNRAHGVVGTPE